MVFLNEKHKELMLKSINDLKELHKLPINYEEELKRHRQMRIIAQRMEEEEREKGNCKDWE